MNLHSKHSPLGLALLAALGLWGGASAAAGTGSQTADDTVRSLAPVEIQGEHAREPIAPAPSGDTITRVNAEGIRLFGGPAQSNPWTALRAAPSVNFQSADPYGLGRPSSLRLRGKSSTHIGRTLNGLPIAGEPGFANGKGGADLVDLENLSSISLTRGPVAADRGFGFSNSGVVDSELRWPEHRFSAQAAQSFGTYDFRRTFVRLDTGDLGSHAARAFVSVSDTLADQWRGPGDSRRTNIEAAIALDISPRIQAKLYGVHHQIRWHSNRALSHAQAQDESQYEDIVYNDRLTGNAKDDVFYYQFNRQDLTNKALIGDVRIALGDHDQIVFKPYYWQEKGWVLSGSANELGKGKPGVNRWNVDHDNYGFDLHYESRPDWGEWRVGYWYQSSEAPPPPTDRASYEIQPDGSLAFRQWSTLAETTRHKYMNPYATVTWQYGPVELSGGLRYMQYKDPSFQYFEADGVTPSPDMYSKGRTYRSWLPNAGIAWHITPDLLASAHYGRTYGRQNWGSVASTYTQNKAAFQAAGLHFNDIWNGLRPEQSDNYDLGLRYSFPTGYIASTLYYTRYKHKQLNMFDPDINVSYHQSAARATAKGLELELGLNPVSDLDVYLSWSWNKASYDDDIATKAGTVIPVGGKQMQDSPRHMAKATAVWRPGAWTLMLAANHIGSRFGDTEEKERVASHTVFDAGVSYDFSRFMGIRDASLGLTVSNLFDKRYIGVINSSDYTVGGKPSYYPGAPRTVVLALSGRF